MKLKDVRDQIEVGDIIKTKTGVIGDNNYLPRSYKIEVVRIENIGNSIKLYFDKNKVDNLEHDKSAKNNNSYRYQIRGNILSNYVTASMIDSITKNPRGIDATVELFKKQILKKETNIKNLLGNISKEKEGISEIEDKIEFIKTYNLDVFDNKKYRAFKLIEEVKKIANGTSSSNAIDAVSKLI